MLTLLRRLIAEETGQDLIEYALLTGALGCAGIVGVNLLGAAISASYRSWDRDVNNLWEVPPPQGMP